MKKWNELSAWQQDAVNTIKQAVAHGEAKTVAAEKVVARHEDEITAQEKRRTVIRTYDKYKDIAPESDEEYVVEEPTFEPWKIATVRIYNLTPLLANGYVDWKHIAEDLERAYPEIEVHGAQLKEKLRRWYGRNPKSVEKINMILQSEKIEQNIEKHTAGSATVTTAHINDDDEMEPLEEEVIPAPKIIRIDMDNKTKQVSAELEVLIGQNDGGKLHDENFIIRTLGYDPEYFELISASVREGTWGIQKKGGALGMLSSKRVMANIRPRKDSVQAEAFAREFRKHIDGYQPRKVAKRTVKGDNIAIVTIADLHLGKLAWKLETGENYDHRIARNRFFYIIDTAISRIKAWKELGEPVEKIIFFWSQDFFHFDTCDATTTAGTRQDTDVRWQKLFYMGCKMLSDAIQSLSEVCPVETFYTRSNHDQKNGYNAILYLDAFFHDDENVIIDTSPIGRKYLQYGVNLFGFGHGDKEGKRIAATMALEAAKQWGETTSREFFLGHFHKRHTEDDESGVVLRYLASPTSTDAWHYESGYLGAQKQAQVFIRNKQTGPVAEFPIPIPYDPEE